MKFFSTRLNKIIPSNNKAIIQIKLYKKLVNENCPIPNKAYLNASIGATKGLKDTQYCIFSDKVVKE